MITLEYLQDILRGKIPAIHNKEHVMESAGGYDGIVSLIQTKGLPLAIILENSEVGEFSIKPGGFLKTSQSVWVMKMVPKDGNRRKIQDDCFALMKRIIGVFVNHEKDNQLAQWEWDRIPWGVRNAGANYTGYEFTVYFSEDTDLGYHG